jgi:hypothetical protein
MTKYCALTEALQGGSLDAACLPSTLALVPPKPPTSSAVRTIRAELGRITAAVAEVERALTELDDGGEPERPARARRRPDRYYLVLLGVYEQGRQGLDSAQFGALGALHGYDRRGLGGFFVGARASLRHAGERIRLTDEGLALLDEYLEATS